MTPTRFKLERIQEQVWTQREIEAEYYFVQIQTTLSAGNIVHQQTSLRFIGLDTKPDFLIQLSVMLQLHAGINMQCLSYLFLALSLGIKYLDHTTHDNESSGGKNMVTISSQAHPLQHCMPMPCTNVCLMRWGLCFKVFSTGFRLNEISFNIIISSKISTADTVNIY